ncbi:nicotinamide riboside kinase [Ceratobasidium sp. AG-Ba]|nr:nicotinamide riboside kinase [Ceratobasidium sp. AG-Ba]
METRVVLIGIGGASSAGKSTLATQLCAMIPGCMILRQDLSVQPIDETPMHPVANLRDLEDPPTAINWPAFREAFKRFRSNRPFDDSHSKSSDTSTPSVNFSGKIANSSLKEWRSRFKRLQQEQMQRGIKIEWRLVEGFLLYYEPEIMKSLDLSIFLRSPGHVLQRRRQGRKYIHSDGTIHIDPPEQWDLISYPAYIRGHEHLFRDGNVETGSPLEPLNLVMLEGEGTERNMTFEEFFVTAANAILQAPTYPPYFSVISLMIDL